MGYQVSQEHLSRVFSELPKQRCEPSLRLFKAMAKACGLSLDEMNEVMEKVRRTDCPRINI